MREYKRATVNARGRAQAEMPPMDSNDGMSAEQLRDPEGHEASVLHSLRERLFGLSSAETGKDKANLQLIRVGT